MDRCRIALALLTAATAGCGRASPPDSSTPAPTLELSSSSVAFVGVAGTADPAPRSVQVVVTGSGSRAPVADIHYQSGHSWLTVTLSGGAAGYTLSVRPSTAGLAIGDYAADIVLTAPGGVGVPATLAVALAVTDSTAPLIGAPGSLAFTSLLGNATETQIITLAREGGSPLPSLAARVTYDAAPANWVVLTLGGDAAARTVAVRATPFALAARPGIYGATLTIDVPRVPGSPVDVRVLLQVMASTGVTCPPGSKLRYAGGGNGSTEPSDFGRTFFGRYCTLCHASTLSGPARNGAPSGLNWDTLTGVQAQLAWVDLAAASGPLGVHADMPPVALTTVIPLADDRERLGAWIACGAP